tara:strand:+ start:100 stop:318 length:219 start_codon:yes stop_codon:yes gene_type:complete
MQAMKIRLVRLILLMMILKRHRQTLPPPLLIFAVATYVTQYTLITALTHDDDAFALVFPACSIVSQSFKLQH